MDRFPPDYGNTELERSLAVNFDAVKLACFSPTGTTRKILHGIAEGLGAENVDVIDLTLPAAVTCKPDETRGELVLVGVPVYEGRVPQTVIPRLKRLQANETPAVIVVVYGNRDFEDALLELNDLTRTLGFLPVAAGAFIGEHAFARDNRPMANGRPDDEDMAAAKEFGAKIRAKLDGLDSIDAAALITPPGKRPYVYHDRSALEDRSATTREEDCTLCGECEPICPVGAIRVEDTVKTDHMACILCNACVKICPTGARVVDDPTINKIVNWVSRNFQARREPEIFIGACG
jgi:ferredoxin